MISTQLTTVDGQHLEADLRLPDGPSVGAVVVCHPHPQYGGNRFNIVVQELFDILPLAGHGVLRFDFRSEFGGGVDERLDVIAALDHLDTVPALDGVSRILVGYSFGAVVALSTTDERITAIAAIAPPLAMMPVPAPRMPTLVVTPRHDQFSPPEATASIVDDWPSARMTVVESADHFLAGHTRAVGALVCDWLVEPSR